MSGAENEELGVFASQLDRKVHQMWHDGESRESALAEASGRLLASGRVKPHYLRVPMAGWLLRRETSRAAESSVAAAYGPHACAHFGCEESDR